VDPYSFVVPFRLLGDLLRYERVEVFLNVIWRGLDMAMHRKGDSMADQLFEGFEWRHIVAERGPQRRIDLLVELLKTILGARWVTPIRMMSDTNTCSYVLVHFTNSDRGRDVMKDAVWAACPEGGTYAWATDRPEQLVLIRAAPDLSPVKTWILDRLRSGPRHLADLHADVRAEVWRPTSVSTAAREMLKAGSIQSDQEKFVIKKNPVLRLP
jgi:hypothetical protein